MARAQHVRPDFLPLLGSASDAESAFSLFYKQNLEADFGNFTAVVIKQVPPTATIVSVG